MLCIMWDRLCGLCSELMEKTYLTFLWISFVVNSAGTGQLRLEHAAARLRRPVPRSRLFRIFTLRMALLRLNITTPEQLLQRLELLMRCPTKEPSEKMRLHWKHDTASFLFYGRRNCSFTPTCQLRLNVTLYHDLNTSSVILWADVSSAEADRWINSLLSTAYHKASEEKCWNNI